MSKDFLQFEEIHEECGIFAGFCKKSNAAPLIKNALLKLQHRGQDGAGICCGDKKQTIYKNRGLVNSALDDAFAAQMRGSFGIGHVRYSTFGDDSKENIQPIKINYLGEDVSLAHNGNVAQAAKIREKFERIGEVFLSTSDSEVILKRIVFSIKKKPSEWIFEDVVRCLSKNFDEGSYCICLYLPDRIMAFRDPLGFRPLMFCRAKEGYFAASEDVAFCGLEIEEIIEIEAGCGVEITPEGYEIKRFSKAQKEERCVFEQIYFASPASNIFYKNVYQTRIKLGEMLACEDDTTADVVIPVMDSGLACAIGYHSQSGIPFDLGLIRNNWLGRSFIQPDEKGRKTNVQEKFIPVKPAIEGKNIILVDDSLVRGTTSSQIIKILKNAGAKKVHMRSVSPKIVNTCIWGVDIGTKEELVAHNRTDEQIAAQIGADSVKFLSIEALDKVFDGKCWCRRCFLDDTGCKNAV